MEKSREELQAEVVDIISDKEGNPPRMKMLIVNSKGYDITDAVKLESAIKASGANIEVHIISEEQYQSVVSVGYDHSVGSVAGVIARSAHSIHQVKYEPVPAFVSINPNYERMIKSTKGYKPNIPGKSKYHS